MKSTQNPVVAYFKSAFEELGKVTWPTKEQAALLTGLVIGVSFVVAVYLGLLDLGLSQGYQALLKALPESSDASDNGSAVIDPENISVDATPVDTTDTSDSSSQ